VLTGPGSDDLLAGMDHLLGQLPPTQAELAEQLRSLTAGLRVLIESMQAEIDKLRRELSRDSNNSSKPPSSDTLTQRAAPAARRQGWKKEKGKRKAGKQPGAPGRHLAQVDASDVVVVPRPTACQDCGASLADAPVEKRERRQVFDLPELRVSVTEWVLEHCRCACGTLCAGEFPPEATGPACWGPNVATFASYLLAYQHVPVARTAELMEEALGAPVSTGWLAGLLPRARALLEESGFLEGLRGHLRSAEVIGADETKARISGVAHWLHTVSTPALTLIECHENRGTKAMDAMGILPGFAGVAMHDRYAPYFTYPCDHACCGAHLLRDLKGVGEIPGQREWTDAMAALLLEAQDKAGQARERGSRHVGTVARRRISERYDEIVTQAIRANPDPLLRGRVKRTKLEADSNNLALAFQSRKDQILRFLNDLRVPFTNNLSERDLRMAKLQQKISGCFRSLAGARAFCAARSYVGTARKHGVTAFEALTRLFHGAPWRIPDAAPT